MQRFAAGGVDRCRLELVPLRLSDDAGIAHAVEGAGDRRDVYTRFVEEHGLYKLLGTIRYPGAAYAT